MAQCRLYLGLLSATNITATYTMTLRKMMQKERARSRWQPHKSFCRSWLLVFGLSPLWLLGPATIAHASELVHPAKFTYDLLRPTKNCDEDENTREQPCCVGPTKTAKQKRADALLASGHYQNAIKEYLEDLASRVQPDGYREFEQSNLAYAYEQLGQLDKALEISSGFKILLFQKARLLIKLQQFESAKSLASRCLANEQRKEKKNGGGGEVAAWSQLRAEAEADLHQDKEAVVDLEEAAKRFIRYDAERAKVCIDDANVLILRSKLGQPVKDSTLKLPQIEQARVRSLLTFICNSSNPFDTLELSHLIGSNIKLPGKVWTNICQIDELSTCFKSLEYRTFEEEPEKPEIFNINISTDVCCVLKDSVLNLLPAGSKSIPTASLFNDFRNEDNLSSWLLPSGQVLTLAFSPGPFRIVSAIELIDIDYAKNLTHEKTPLRLWQQAQQLERAGTCVIDETVIQREIDLLSESIKIDNEVPSVFRDRGYAYVKLKKFPEALVDFDRAIELGGRPYLHDRAFAEELMGKCDLAEKDLLKEIGTHHPGPEVKTLWTQLASVYLKQKQYLKALQAADNAMVDSQLHVKALFLKAQAEAGLNRMSDARKDGRAASQQYFNLGRIVLRDQVDAWLKSIGSSEDSSK